MHNASDAVLLRDLLDHFESRQEALTLTQTISPLIVPALGSGYALDSEGHVIGIKLGFSHATQEALEKVLRFRNLKKLVFYAGEEVAFPPSIAQLNSLDFLSLGGEIRSLPPEILSFDLPIYVAGHSREENTRGYKNGRGAREFMDVVHDLSIAVHGLFRSSGTELTLSQRAMRDEQAEYVITQFIKGGRLDAAVFEEILAGAPFTDIAPEGIEECSVQIANAVKKLLSYKDMTCGIFLSVHGLQDPPIEIVSRGVEAVASYFAARDAGELPLNEAKVLLVGNGSAGKTSLVKQIFSEHFDPNESQTHGIRIRRWSESYGDGLEIKANFWDFGGQEIMHATHQFFLSKRSLYIVVLDGRKEEDAEYWLQHIESFGGDSPVIVVLNKIDEHASFEVNRRFLRQKYKGITTFHRISCANGTGIQEFVSDLRKQLRDVPILQTKWPHSWFRVKQQLENRGTAYISMAEYGGLCHREGILDRVSQDTLVDFLNDLGVILHFRDLELIDTHVLDPRWVTEAVYRIINSDTLADQRGFLALDQMSDILQPWEGATFTYSVDKHRYIIDLMLKFQLCYQVADDAVLVPDLLDVQQPEIEFDYDGALRFVFEYAYLPKSVMPRFIVRMHRDIIGMKRWRTGVALSDPTFGATAVVSADVNAKRINVFVSGDQRRDYFATIRKVINEITASFEKLPLTEFVPLPDAPSVLLDYQELIGHEAAGKTDIFVGRLRKSYKVQSLLSGIEVLPDNEHTSGATVYNIEGDYFVGPSIGVMGNATIAHQQINRSQKAMGYEPQKWERVIAYITGVLVVALIGYLAVRNQPFADPNIVVLLRTILSVAVAILGATVPGMLNVDFTNKGVAIRATGAIALFVVTFLLTPRVLPQVPE